MSLVEVLVGLGILSLALLATVAFSVERLARQNVDGAARELQGVVQRCRLEARDRHRDVRLVIDRSRRSYRLLDSMGTPTDSDDRPIGAGRLPGAVVFASPEREAVDLEGLGCARRQVRFNENGMVTAGAGSLSVFGAERYIRVSLFASRTTWLETWDGSGWGAEGD